MTAQKTSFKNFEKTQSNKKIEVQYQKIGKKWYAYTIINDEVFYGEVPEKCIDELPIEELITEKSGTFVSKAGNG